MNSTLADLSGKIAAMHPLHQKAAVQVLEKARQAVDLASSVQETIDAFQRSLSTLTGSLSEFVLAADLRAPTATTNGSENGVASHSRPAALLPPEVPVGCCALVIEGDALHRKVAVRVLEKAGYAVDLAPSAQEAIDAFQRGSYSIVLLDCDTPEMGGFETAAAMRRLEGEPHRIPIIALTGNHLQADRHRRQSAGIDNYISKPIRREKVQAILGRYAPTSALGMASPLGPLDRGIVAELYAVAEDDPGLLRELIDLFLTSAPLLLDQMRQAAMDGDAEKLGRMAHALKGSSGQMGAVRMQEICAAIETLARSGALAGIDALLTELSHAFEHAASDLNASKGDDIQKAAGTNARTAPLSPPEVRTALKGSNSSLPEAFVECCALVIEGDPLHRKVAMRVLEKAGYAVDLAASAQEAIDAFQRRSYSVVLLDCDTPEMVGFETAAAMRRLEGQPHRIPIIALTANITQADRRRRQSAGIDNYISKPIRREKVQAILGRYAPTSALRMVSPLGPLDTGILAELHAVAEDDPRLLWELIDLFLTGAPLLLDQMREAVMDGAAESLCRMAHTLKGSSGQMGALRMQEICATIETLARSGALAGVDALLPEISLAFERAACDLRALEIQVRS